MITTRVETPDEELADYLADAAYQALLRRGIKRSFLDVELEVWVAMRKLVGWELYGGSRTPQTSLPVRSAYARTRSKETHAWQA